MGIFRSNVVVLVPEITIAHKTVVYGIRARHGVVFALITVPVERTVTCKIVIPTPIVIPPYPFVVRPFLVAPTDSALESKIFKKRNKMTVLERDNDFILC